MIFGPSTQGLSGKTAWFELERRLGEDDWQIFSIEVHFI